MLDDALNRSESSVSEWFDKNFSLVIEAEGAVLNMHGRRSDLEDFRYKAKRSLSNLLTQLKAAGIVRVQSELELSGNFPGGAIHGYADLVLTSREGKQAIVDMKWGSRPKYYEKLLSNSHLQLGIYAELLRQETQAWPDVAYYILSEAKLFAQNDYYFPNTSVVNKKIDESTAQLWERFKSTYQWRKSLLTDGAIEVVLEGLEETDESVHPETGLKPEILNQNYNEYLSLAGWRSE
jgi:hypothetical protein